MHGTLSPPRGPGRRVPAAWFGLQVSGWVSASLSMPALAAPAAGRYDGHLCVATATAAAPDCGPARVELRGAGQALVRVSDFLYSLTLQGGQADVVLKHGAMQIDGFTAVYEWKPSGNPNGASSGRGNSLHFVDADKGVRYEVRLGERRP